MKIMVCHDRSEPAKRALHAALEQAKAFHGEVVVVTTLEKGDPEHQDQINAAKKDLEHARTLVATEGIPCQTDLLIRGLSTGEDLVRFAEDRHIDLIVIGIVKTSKVGKLFFGSTAQYLILKAPCPVMTVR